MATTATTMATAPEDGLVNFDALATMESVRERRGRDLRIEKLREEDENSERSERSAEEGSGPGTPTEVFSPMRSVLTRKPSVAALKLFSSMDVNESEAVSENIDAEEGDEDVCSLSEFAMVLNVAAWVRVDLDRCFDATRDGSIPELN